MHPTPFRSKYLNNSTSTPKIGLALGSGASRGWSHIGVIKALLREGIEPDIVCGTSIGAIVGGSYVAGNLENLESWILSSTRSDVLRFFDISLSQSGFVNKERLSWFLDNYVATTDQLIENLPKKFGTVSTNLITGREIWVTEGGLTDAVRASMALPGLFPAVRNDQHWLVDGGLVNPVPVTTCRALGADIVIAVNLNSGIIGKHKNEVQQETLKDDQGLLSNLKQQAKEYSSSLFPDRDNKDDPPSLFFAIANSLNIVQDRITRSRLAGDPADILLSPQLAHIGMLEFQHAAEAVKEGEDCVQRMLAEILRVADKA